MKYDLPQSVPIEFESLSIKLLTFNDYEKKNSFVALPDLILKFIGFELNEIQHKNIDINIKSPATCSVLCFLLCI